MQRGRRCRPGRAPMSAQRFVAVIEGRPGGSIAIRLPFDPSAVWGDKDRHYVCGAIEGRQLRGTLLVKDDIHYLQLGPAWCRDRPVKPGERVAVTLEPEGPQVSTLAEDFRAALVAEAPARRFFESLATFYRKGYLRWIEGAKRPETRAKRIDESVAALMAQRPER
jgi:hypothetical protein